MASEYLKWKYRDIQHREAVVMTPAEQRKNWWHYHKWHVTIGLTLAVLCAYLLCQALGVGQIRPDYQVAYVGTDALPEDTAAAIERAFAALGEDLNGDGQVVVRLNQYASTSGADTGAAASAEVTLMADLLECESYFFLLENPAWFQVNYHSLCRLDGSLPEDGDHSADGTFLAWGDCPALAGMELGGYSYDLLGETVEGDSGELFSKLYLARRGFWTEKTATHPDGCAALWEELTEGAVS